MKNQEVVERWVATGDQAAFVAAVLRCAIDSAVGTESASITTREMAVMVGGEEMAPKIQGAIDDAALDLANHGLIHSTPLDRHQMIEPTRAALRFNELLGQ